MSRASSSSLKRKEKKNKIPIKSENKRKENKNCPCPERLITFSHIAKPLNELKTKNEWRWDEEHQ